ncbi:MAG TPA: PAS domain S-box protein [Ignavibacteriales bacterium]|nr:PAS domain S-box protein [Ignavibacteriales bacterium]
MTYKNKTKKELIEELEALQRELRLLKGSSNTAPSQIDLHRVELNDYKSGSFAEFAGGILDCVPANIALIDNSGKIIAVNSSWKQFAGENGSVSRDQYLGANYLEVCQKTEGEVRSQAINAARGIKNVLEGKSPRFALEYPCHSETEKRWFRLFVTPFTYKGEKCAVVMHINITGNVKTEKSLSESGLNQLHDTSSARAFINNASDAIVVLGPDGKIIDVNDETCSRLLYTREEMLKLTLWDVIAPANFSLAAKRLHEITSNGSAFFETVYLRKDGVPVPLECAAQLVDHLGQKAIVGIGKDIALRKHDNELLLKLNKETIAQSNALLDAIPDMILLINSRGVFLDAHIPESNSSEFPLKDFIGKKVRDVLPGLVTEKTKHSFREVLRTGEMFVMDFPLVLEGIPFFYETRMVKCGEDKLLLLVRNVTEKKKQENEIHKLSLAVEQSPIIVLITDKKGRIEYVNPRFTEVTGYSIEETIGSNPGILKSGLTPPDQYKELWSKLSRGEHWNGEFRNRKKNGELFWELASIFPIKNSLGEVTQFVAVKEDITERKETELRLAEYRDHLEQLVEQRTESLSKVNQLLNVQIEKYKAAEEKVQNQLQFLRTLIGTIPNPLLIKDKTGRVTDCNKAYERLFGQSLDEIKNKRVEDFVPPVLVNKILEIEKELLSKPGHISAELTRQGDNGEPFTVLVDEATYLEADGSIGGTVVLLIDISEQKKLQESIQTALEKEQELNELKSSFISMASHEFRTPLTSILASADLLEMFGRNWNEEKYLEHTGKIQKAVDYMKELLDDVLVISRNEEGKTQFTPSKTNFLELCSELLDSARISSSENHKLIFNYKTEQKLFVIDPKLLRHIISNLLSNAVKYSPNGGNVSLNVRTENNYLHIVVADEGIGIPEVDKARLFEPFYRAGNTAAIHGTGLGMSIVKRSVELHNGRLSIESEENRGTEVHVVLPFE